MSKKQIKFTIVGLVVIGVLLGLWLLSNALASGILRHSKDVHEARKKNVIITEYACMESGISISSCHLTPIEAWSEHYWEYKDIWRNVKIHKEPQFLVRFSLKDKRGKVNDCFEKYEVLSVNSIGNGFCGHDKLCFSIMDAVIPDSFSIVIENEKRFFFKKIN